LGIARHLQAGLLAPDEISRYISFPREKRRRLIGVVVSVPNKSSERTDFVLACERLIADEREVEVTGKTQVFLYTCEPNEINYGGRVSLSGRLSLPLASGNLRLFDYRKYLSYGNIHSLFSVYRREDIEILGQAKIFTFRLVISKIRQRIDSVIISTLPQLECSVLAGVMLGERRGLSRQIQEISVDARVLHTVAVSGLHVSLVLFIFYGFFRLIRIPKMTTYFLQYWWSLYMLRWLVVVPRQ
jgi:predicted membrane metal-binding protein